MGVVLIDDHVLRELRARHPMTQDLPFNSSFFESLER
jgi:hypothetical protein